MSTPRVELMNFLTGLPGLSDDLERKALVSFVGDPHIGIYLRWSGNQVQFAEALIDELSRRGQAFTVTYLKNMENAPQVGMDHQAALARIRDQISQLSQPAWMQEFPAEPLTDQDRTALVADLDMLAATVVSTMLLPYYELGADEMEAKAGATAAKIAANVAARVEATFAANPFAGPMLGMFKQSPKQNEAEFLKGVRAMLSQDDALAKDLAEILTTELPQDEAALQAMVNVSQTIRTVQGNVVGALVGNDVVQSISVQQDVNEVSDGGVLVGAIVGKPGSSMNIGGQHYHGPTYTAGSQHTERTFHAEGGAIATQGGVAASQGGVAVGGNVSGSNIVTGSGNTITDRTVDTGGGAYISGSVDVSGGDFVGRDKITTSYGLGGQDITALFAQTYALIGHAQINPAYDKDEVRETTKRIEKDVAQGETVDVAKLERRLKNLLDMAPDVADVVIAGLANPVAGVATAVSKLAQRMKASLG